MSQSDDDTSTLSTDAPIQTDELVSREYLLKGALIVLGVIAVAALFGFYSSMMAVINEWVARRFQPIFKAVFNLVVLLVAGIGISLILRKLSG